MCFVIHLVIPFVPLSSALRPPRQRPLQKLTRKPRADVQVHRTDHFAARPEGRFTRNQAPCRNHHELCRFGMKPYPRRAIAAESREC